MIFEENIITVSDAHGRPTYKSTWEKKLNLPAIEPPEDLKFCPRGKGNLEAYQIGLRLATVNTDGKLNTYDLRKMQDTRMCPAIHVSSEPLTCLSWNKNSSDGYMIMVGGKRGPKKHKAKNEAN